MLPQASSAGRLKVLIAAYACNPFRGSEAGVGWGWVNAISRLHDVWVITGEEQGKADIELALARQPELGQRLNFVFLARPPLPAFLRHFPPLYFRTYRKWQESAFRIAAGLHKQVGFHIAHQLTYVGFREPGQLWKLGIPFVWGPIGGLENTPWGLLPLAGLRGGAYLAGRNAVNWIHKSLNRAPKAAFARADAVIAATRGIRDEISKWYGRESSVICEVGPAVGGRGNVTAREPGESLELVWSGVHIAGKALPVLLRALSCVPARVDWRLHVLGDGPCRGKWERAAVRLKIQGRCCWYGNLPRQDALHIMERAHVMCITSIKDLTSSVLVEALSIGLPVVCLRHCGFADLVDDTCGIAVDPNRSTIATHIAEAIVRLWGDEAARMELSRGARRRVLSCSWDIKGQDVDAIYRHVIRNVASAVCPGCQEFAPISQGGC